jgi:hypothetical protein
VSEIKESIQDKGLGIGGMGCMNPTKLQDPPAMMPTGGRSRGKNGVPLSCARYLERSPDLL